MLDPIIQAALVALVKTVISYVLATYFPSIPIPEETVNAIATLLVTWLLALATYRAFRTAILKREAGKKLLANGILAEKAD